MNLPELPPDAANKWHHVDDLSEYGAACYAKGRADLLKEIGDPVAEAHEYGRTISLVTTHKGKIRLGEGDLLYVLPKEPT